MSILDQGPGEQGRRNRVSFERTYAARVEDLWALWTTKSGFESWWGPDGFRVRVHTLEARLGGALHYDMFATDLPGAAAMERIGRTARTVTRGRFIEFNPHAELTIEHDIDFVPDVKPYVHKIYVRFLVDAANTKMIVEVDALHNEEMTGQAVAAFESQLLKIDSMFNAGDPRMRIEI